MIILSTRPLPKPSLRAIAGGLLVLLAAACSGDGTAPTSQAAPSDTTATAPTDTTVAPHSDTTAAPPVDSSATQTGDSTSTTATGTPTQEAGSLLPGIAFGSFDMENQYLSSVHTGTVRGGGLSPTNILSLLSDARAKGARVVIKLCMGRDSYVKNSDGTF